MTDSLPEAPDIDPAALAATGFSRARKGFEPAEVHAVLGRTADALRIWQLRDAQLSERVRELDEQLASAQELDEERLTAVLGEETARVISAARDAAGQIRANAEEQAAALLAETDAAATSAAEALKAEATSLRDEAARLRDDAASDATTIRTEAESSAAMTLADAQQRSEDLLQAAESVLATRTAEAEQVVAEMLAAAAADVAAAAEESAAVREAARLESLEEIERARESGRMMVAETKALRERMLADLAERRLNARRQIEGALAARDRVAEVLRAAGAQLDETVEGLDRIDVEASAAADAAAAAIDVDVDAELAALHAELGDTAEPELAEAVGVERILDGNATDGDELAEGEPEADLASDEAGDADDAADGAHPDTTDDTTAEVTADIESEGAGGAAADEPIAASTTVEVSDEVVVVDTDEGELVIETVETIVDHVEVVAHLEPHESPASDAEVIGIFDARSDETVENSAVGIDAEIDDELDDDGLDGEPDEDDTDVEASDDAAATDGGAEGEGDGATVHDLFARIRAEGIDAEGGSDDSDGGPAPAAANGRGDDDEIDLTETPVASAASRGSGGDEHRVAGGGVDVAVRTDQDLLDTRDELLAPIEKSLSRALKRLASDEQNEILDKLRRVKRGRPDVATILPTDDTAYADHYVESLLPEFIHAVDAGATFWEEVAGTATDSLFGGEALVEECLRARVVLFLTVHRAHLERTFTEADEAGVDVSELGDRVRASYRDWRSTTLADLAGDLATAGFTHGERRAAGPGTPWQWIVDNGGLPCADGEDNALAGAVPCEEPFPTGDLTPPAHPGCRCILAPARR